MKLVAERSTTQSARIYALEEARKADTDRLAKIEEKVGEIHTLLVQAKGVIWLATKITGSFAAFGAIAVAGITIWRFAAGH